MEQVGTESTTIVGKLALVPTGRTAKPKRILRIIRSVFNAFTVPGKPSDWPKLGSRVTGTLFGYRKGHVHFAVQEDPRSPPVLLIEFAAIATNFLLKEMASGLVRIVLECERAVNRGGLYQEPIWTMYCNGKKNGYAMKRSCSTTEDKIFEMVQAVSVGAGVVPTDVEGPDGELMYMRASFERVAGSRDSEAFYMMNPDGTGGPELSIFLLRI